MGFVATISAEELWEGELKPLQLAGKKLFLVKCAGGVRAFADRCPHQNVPLTEGWLEGCRLTCSAHQWEFDLATGKGMNPESARLTSYPVKLADGKIFVDPDAGGPVP